MGQVRTEADIFKMYAYFNGTILPEDKIKVPKQEILSTSGDLIFFYALAVVNSFKVYYHHPPVWKYIPYGMNTKTGALIFPIGNEYGGLQWETEGYNTEEEVQAVVKQLVDFQNTKTAVKE